MKHSSSFIDFRSLKFKLLLYFGLFAVVIMIVLWLLQVFFLSYYYQDMKVRETQRIAASIETRINSDVSRSEIRAYISDIYRTNEMYIQVVSEGGTPIYIPNVKYDDEENLPEVTLPDTDDLPDDLKEGTGAEAEPIPRSFYPTIYRAEIDNLRDQLVASGQNSISKEVKEPTTDQKTLEYAAFLKASIPPAVLEAEAAVTEAETAAEATGTSDDTTTPSTDAGTVTETNATEDEEKPAQTPAELKADRMILYIFSPLYPMQSYVQILTNQLIYVTIISLLLSIIIAFYLSRMITKPLTSITESAEELADGNFGVSFEGDQYTEVVRLSDMLSYTSNELAKARNMQRDVIANVSHDLKTPLTMISSYAEMISDISGNNPEKRAAHLQVIMNETERLNSLITELLDISKLQSGEKHVNLTSFSLKETIQNIVASYSAFVEQEGYKLIFISNGPGEIRADAARIKQVLDNLISNALKYGGKNKTVEIKLIEEGTYVRCEVTDHGMGIPKKDLKHIWERYYKSSTHYSRRDSTGLGLSIVKEILVLHKAEFGVESTVKKGSTFWFQIKKEAASTLENPQLLATNKTEPSIEDKSTEEPESTFIDVETNDDDKTSIVFDGASVQTEENDEAITK